MTFLHSTLHTKIKLKLEKYLPDDSKNCIWNSTGLGTSTYVQNEVLLNGLEHAGFDWFPNSRLKHFMLILLFY